MPTDAAMSSGLRRWALARGEGLGFVLALAVAAPAICVCGAVGVARRGCTDVVWRRLATSSLKRWAKFAVQGLACVREAWWGEFAYERLASLCRYLVYIEVFNLMNLARGARGRTDSGRIMVVKLTHLGDLLLTVPFLRGLRAHAPRAEIDLLAGPWSEGLARRIPYVDRVVAYAPILELFNRGNLAPCGGVLREFRFLLALRRRRYGVLYSASTTRIVELALIHALAPDRWIGAAHDVACYADPCEARTVGYSTAGYEAERVASLLELDGGPGVEPRLEYWVTAQERSGVRDFLARHGVGADAVYIVVAPGGGWSGKLWPDERFAALADALASDSGACIVLAGSKAERPLAESVARRMTGPSVVAAGELSFDELGALLESAALLVGNDSAPVHLAAAVGTPTLSFFGPTKPAQWAPRGPAHRHLAGRTPCDGCRPWHQRATCLHDRRCMKEIAEADARAEAFKLLTEHQTHRPVTR